jgi:hypothetical protein
MQVVARLEKVFGVAVPLRRLFEAPTVGGLAAAIDELLEGNLEALEDRRPT